MEAGGEVRARAPTCSKRTVRSVTLQRATCKSSVCCCSNPFARRCWTVSVLHIQTRWLDSTCSTWSSITSAWDSANCCRTLCNSVLSADLPRSICTAMVVARCCCSCSCMRCRSSRASSSSACCSCSRLCMRSVSSCHNPPPLPLQHRSIAEPTACLDKRKHKQKRVEKAKATDRSGLV